MTSCKIYGVGVKDLDDSVTTSPEYQRWVNMLARCYATTGRNPSYLGTTVCEEWLTYSLFKEWVLNYGDTEGKELDKDLLGDGDVYSPSTCCFISKKLNLFLSSFFKNSGASSYRGGPRWRSYVTNPFTGKQESLKIHNTKEEALEACWKRKQDFARKFISLESDPRVVTKLKDKFELEDLV